MHFFMNCHLIKQNNVYQWVVVVLVLFFFLKLNGRGVPDKSVFYKRYVDDTFIHRKKNVNDELFQNWMATIRILN